MRQNRPFIAIAYKIRYNYQKNMYNTKYHPEVLNGTKSQEDAFEQFCYSLDLYCDTCANINSILHNPYGAPSGYDISSMFALFHPKL